MLLSVFMRFDLARESLDANPSLAPQLGEGLINCPVGRGWVAQRARRGGVQRRDLPLLRPSLLLRAVPSLDDPAAQLDRSCVVPRRGLARLERSDMRLVD